MTHHGTHLPKAPGCVGCAPGGPKGLAAGPAGPAGPIGAAAGAPRAAGAGTAARRSAIETGPYLRRAWGETCERVGKKDNHEHWDSIRIGMIQFRMRVKDF